MNRSIIIAIVIAVLAVGWLASGVFKEEIAQIIGGSQGNAAESEAETVSTVSEPAAEPARKPSSEATEHRDTMKVQTEVFRAQPRSVDIVLRGRTDSVRTVELMAETSGTVVDLYKKKGETVKRGDRIARLSVQDREARRLEAVALVKQREIEHEGAVKLAAKGFKSETAVAAAAALLDAARAARKRVEVEIAQLTLRAPFDGTIAKRHVQLGTFVGIGDPVATIVDLDPILVVGNVSEREIGQIAVGAPARAVLVGGTEVTGTVRFIAPTAEAATRTFRVEVEVDNPDGAIRDGITAEIMLRAGEAPAHLLSPAILTLNSAGEVGVRVIDHRGIVQFMPVNILADGSDGVWVTGLPSEIEVITVGQEFVREGEPVEVARAPDTDQ
ncbi:efflux RND transporter periplasmic adaptor subunit [Minwuia sp.]|uniref:efflux RND transporter periplasmic adaptor subunit n=1 Tax=Minwuia sp. TaxID=2493630 RepID=UPI003A95127E